jgi:hypothetical protein
MESGARKDMLRQQQAPAPPAKKPYAKPELHIYGSIHALTKNVGSKGSLDNLGGAAAGPKSA